MEDRKRVLVMEDDTSMRALLSLTFRDAGYDVLESAGANVPDLLVGPIDLAVIDINQPKAMHPERIAVVRTAFPSVPVIAISGYFPTQAHAMSMLASRFGVERALAKPFKREALLQAAAALIDRGAKGSG
ncbi:response regulator [Paraburkholderia sp. JPY432]|uniref:response regulator n=1 Tax=Paraburkholderia TaxID=1822464 RepID=UPI0015962D79|nr:response regulator [Paraburkholderia youngii]